MGCDIHFYIEVKTKNGWELYSHPNIKRKYILFAKLSNVRNYDNIDHFEIKGLPKDISYIVKKSYEGWRNDAHSANYITGNEIVELEKWLEEYKPYGDKGFLLNDLEFSILNTWFEGNSFAGFYKYPDERPGWVFDIRFVFWFDN
jgi:hypothetical protein